ncbi:hypothetical protein JOC36_001649 [Weissella uvarum]|uniref:hypothetical protein n=1 Tax=Weissella uvarum TaxID=1479233 RepID=UPI00196154BE|nr:hypothetical protein [Weissella uvarum]MBM7618049.1 hypothetical protein [Weissella uvarum]MCM0595094.1 hypothetical protein [Weissella uvarum]
MRRSRKLLWVGLVIAVILVLGITIWALRPQQQAKPDQSEETVKPTKMQALSESGEVKARHQQAIPVPAGKVQLYEVNGASVNAGEVIGQVVDVKAEQAARETLQKLATEIANTQAAGKATTQLQSEQTKAQGALQKATRQIVAPYAGILDINDEDTSNVKIMILSQNKYIDSSVTDYDYDNVVTGNRVHVTTNAGNMKSTEKISYVSQVAQNGGKMTSYEFKTTANPKYRIGQQVTIKIPQDKLILPASAVQTTQGHKYIYIVQNGHATKEAITAKRSGATYIFDAKDLDADVSVIKNPGNRQLDGKKV